MDVCETCLHGQARFCLALRSGHETFRVNAFAHGVPSLLAALALCVLHYVMERYGGKGSGLFSVMVTASCGFFFAVRGVVAIDVLLSACVAGSLLAYFAFTCETSRAIRKRWSLLVFALLALGFRKRSGGRGALRRAGAA